MDKNIKILNELHKGAKMGMDSISFVSEKGIQGCEDK